MKLSFFAYGTRGDVQPAIALGQALQQRGHHVKLLASPNFQTWIEGHGLEAIPARVDVQAVMNSKGGHDWIEQGNNTWRQLQVMRGLLAQHGLAMIEDAWEAAQGADAIISQFTSVVYAVSLAENLNVPHICMLLQPTLLATRDGRAMISAPVPGRRSLLNYWFAKLIIEPVGWTMYGGLTNQFRRDVLGLPPLNTRRFLETFTRTPIVLGYSPCVVPHPSDWTSNIHTTGYWFLDEGDWQPPAALTRFLEAGAPPVYIGFGSMTGRNAEGISRLVVEAVQRAGLRAILFSGWAGLGDDDLPDTVLRLDSAPHGWLFPRMAAIVHHGGAGTTGSALRSGVPNIVVPHMADQPFWGERVAQLGVGPRPIPRPKLTAGNLAAALRQATTNADMRRRAAELGAAIRSENGTQIAIDLVEHYLSPR